MIKFVYFDVGGVAILDFSKTNKWKDVTKELGLNEKESKQFIEYWERLAPKIHIGLNINNVFNEEKKKYDLKISTDYSLLKDGFVSRFELNKSIWPVVDYAKKNFKVGLLTNQYPDMLDEIKKENLMPPVVWDVEIDSSIVKLQKPDEAIYKLAEKLANVKGSEIFFIDNSQEHIDGAKDFGWQTFLYDPSNPRKSNQALAKCLKIII